MTSIHMETEWVREMTRRFGFTSLDLAQQASGLRAASSNLSYAWQGSNATRFYWDFQNWLRRFQTQIQNLDYLTVRVEREVLKWETVDNNHSFQDIVTSRPDVGGWGEGGDSGTGGGDPFAYIKNVILGTGIAKDTFRVVVEGAGLPPVALVENLSKALPWISGSILFADLFYQDWGRYSTPEERMAAFVVDAVFATVITALKTGIKGVAVGLLKTSVVSLFTGVGVPLAIAQAFVGVALWAGSEIAGSWAVNAFRDSSLKDGLIRWIAKGLSPGGN